MQGHLLLNVRNRIAFISAVNSAASDDSYEAEKLCSDIIYALVKAAHSDGEIESVYPFIWIVARNIYADFSNNRRKRVETIYKGDAELIKKSVSGYLLGEWRLANNLASMPIHDAVVECLIEKGVLTPPEDGIGAEGCWMSVEK